MSPDRPDIADPSYYVGIGASAGGLEALGAFFENIKRSTGLAYIVIQHLSPEYKSLMVEILGKKTFMAVYRAEEGMVVEADTVYVIPPGRNLTIFHGKLLLEDPEVTQGPNLPIDIFLRSLAADQATRSVAVILSGTGSDGTRGVRAVKEAGGIVMVQDPVTAGFDGMPRAAASTGVADFVLPPDQMAEQLVAFVEHPYIGIEQHPEELLNDEENLKAIFSELREKTSVDFTYYKPSTILRRIERRMSVNHLEGLAEYVGFLQSYPGEVNLLYRELLIGVTSFFRDPDTMTELSERWIPELFNRIQNREIRFWVAGCSTGEEAYTLAILARDVADRMGIYRDVKIFATDIDREAILKAGAGVYPESIAADLSPDLLRKYFLQRNNNFQISRSIREMVVFARHNLVKDPPFTNMDMVSCRNLLIYLQPVLQTRALELFNFSLNAQGVLLLGSSETIGTMTDYFDDIDLSHKIFRSKGRSHRRIGGGGSQGTPDGGGESLTARMTGHRNRYRPDSDDRLLQRFLETASERYVPVSIVVTEDLQILHTTGDTTRFFKVPSGRMEYNVNRMATKELSIPLSTGIHKTFRTGQEASYTNIRLSHGSATTFVDIRIAPLPDHKGQEPLVAVFLEEREHREVSDDEAKAIPFDLPEAAGQRIRDLEQELQFSRENLQATIEELETSNEELQATNEELLASNEELQSTNEELQSTNEELHTVNSEHQKKIIELSELNSDIDNLLTASGVGILIVDENLEIRRFSPEVKAVIRLEQHDIGRPISQLSHDFVDLDPAELAGSVLDSGEGIEYQVETRDGRRLLIRAAPYLVGNRTVSGAVLSFVDVTYQTQIEQRLRSSLEAAEDIIRFIPAGLFLYFLNDDGDLILESANPEAERLTGVDSVRCSGRTFDEIWPKAREQGITERFLKVLRTGHSYVAENVRYQDENVTGTYRIHAFKLPHERLAVSFEDTSWHERQG